MRVIEVGRIPGTIFNSPGDGFETANHEVRCAIPRRQEPMRRPHVRGKFLFVDDEKFWIRGVTYGTFRGDADGVQFPPQDTVQHDFQTMAKVGLNSVRVYTPPPLWLMDTAAAFGLRVMVGLPWEQHIAFLDDRDRVGRVVNDLRSSVRRLAAHPALLCYAVGNEIPASVVRWYGKSRIEKFVGDLAAAAKSEDTDALVTYVNFPTTEYLALPCLDFVSFNVYLENKDQLMPYLARLQNLAGERPLVMTEIGLDSQRNGEEAQAQSLRWQIATAFEAGCVGAFVFSWTDEWFRGGQEIADWDFGVVSRERRPKQALRTVSASFAEAPFPAIQRGQEFRLWFAVITVHARSGRPWRRWKILITRTTRSLWLTMDRATPRARSPANTPSVLYERKTADCRWHAIVDFRRRPARSSPILTTMPIPTGTGSNFSLRR